MLREEFVLDLFQPFSRTDTTGGRCEGLPAPVSRGLASKKKHGAKCLTGRRSLDGFLASSASHLVTTYECNSARHMVKKSCHCSRGLSFYPPAQQSRY